MANTSVRASLRSKETMIMHGVSTVKYDGVSHKLSTPELYQLLSWARTNRPQLAKEYTRLDAQLWHLLESKHKHADAAKAVRDLSACIEKLQTAKAGIV